MKLVYKCPFAEYFQKQIAQGDARVLLEKMQALEVGAGHLCVYVSGVTEPRFVASAVCECSYSSWQCNDLNLMHFDSIMKLH